MRADKCMPLIVVTGALALRAAPEPMVKNVGVRWRSGGRRRCRARRAAFWLKEALGTELVGSPQRPTLDLGKTWSRVAPSAGLELVRTLPEHRSDEEHAQG